MLTVREKRSPVISDEISQREMAISWILDPEEIDPHTGKSPTATEAYCICHPDEAVFRNLIHKRAQRQRNRTMSKCGPPMKKFVSYKNMHILQNTLKAKNALERIGIDNCKATREYMKDLGGIASNPSIISSLM
ncbi:hypothetical protein K3495_g952 [Podosphaera aphanis]|nr:hypothetical protein K3495_g952 [Podosphaera aphanis]